MYIKYFTSDLFNKSEFVKLLRYTMNVEAAMVEDGIILDIDAFNGVSKALMPHWASINSKFINSKLHTQPASKEEFKAAMKKDTINSEWVKEQEAKVINRKYHLNITASNLRQVPLTVDCLCKSMGIV